MVPLSPSTGWCHFRRVRAMPCCVSLTAKHAEQMAHPHQHTTEWHPCKTVARCGPPALPGKPTHCHVRAARWHDLTAVLLTPTAAAHQLYPVQGLSQPHVESGNMNCGVSRGSQEASTIAPITDSVRANHSSLAQQMRGNRLHRGCMMIWETQRVRTMDHIPRLQTIADCRKPPRGSPARKESTGHISPCAAPYGCARKQHHRSTCQTSTARHCCAHERQPYVSWHAWLADNSRKSWTASSPM